MPYDDTNRGVLFKNEKTADNQPDYKGRININGVEFWLSSWIKEAKDKRKFMSLSVTPMEAKPTTKPVIKPADDSEIPF